MKKFSKILMSGLAALCLWACSDEANVSRPADAENDVYVEFGVQLMQGSGSRSETTDKEDENGSNSDDGAEVGKNYENSVKEILLVLTKADGSPIVSQHLDVEPKEDGKYPSLVTTLDRSALEAYKKGEIYVYAFCNPTSTIDINDLTHSTHKLSGKPKLLTDNDEIWKKDAFLMSNHNLVKVANSTPNTVWKWEQYTETNRLSLGIISVERACARFDFKENCYPAGEASNTYVLESDKGVKVQLTDMVMVNISKSFYYLRRVSENGLADNIELCGQETPNNYVVDTDAGNKNGNVGETYKKDYFFNNFLSNSREEWEDEFTSISSLAEEDNDDSWNAGHNRNGYKIWRYATENTIPAPNSNQKNGISTGVIFKGKLQFDKSTYGVTDNQPIYVYNNVLYGTWEKVKDAANAPNADESLKAAFDQIGATPASGADFGRAGFTVLKPNGSGDYEMYYCYWNRHNDNSDPNLMGPMEFAVVRNNVYKLTVNKINGYGHPTSSDPKEDPDPLDPNNPDERNDLYIEVTVEVRPWVVRINDIEF